MANLITLSRLILLFVVVGIAFGQEQWLQFVSVPLMIVVFVTDGLDGYAARRLGTTSVFGAVFDIAADRIVEMTMWVVLAVLGLVAVWVPLVFIVRGTLVDAIRAGQVSGAQLSPFAMMQSPLGKFLVAGRFMRGFYATVKAHAFCWLLLIQPMDTVMPGFWADWGWLMTGIGHGLVLSSVFLCVVRGLPVIVEFALEHRGDFRLWSKGHDTENGGSKPV